MNRLLKSRFGSCQLFFLGFLFVFFSSFSFGFDISTKWFSHITSLDGLTTNNVRSLLMDSRGFLWIGTANGLNRYDGYEVKSYMPSDADINSISGGEIHDLLEDDKGSIWIATNRGLNKFEIRTGRIIRFSLPGNISEYSALKLLIYDGKLFFGTGEGLFSMNLESHYVQTILSGNMIQGIYEGYNELWLGSNVKIFRYSIKSDAVKEFILPVNATIYNILKLRNVLWVGTSEGIIYFNILEESFDLTKHLLPGTMVYNIVADGVGGLLISTREDLYVYSLENRGLRKIHINENDSFYLNSKIVHDIVTDHNGILWIGNDRGVSYTSINKPLSVIRVSTGRLVDNYVLSFEGDDYGNLWITTDTGITRRSKENTHHYKNKFLRKLLVSNTLFLSYGYNKVYRYNEEKGEFESHELGELAHKKYGIRSIRDIMDIGKSQFLLATRQGILLWDEINQSLEQVYFDKESKFNNQIYMLYQYQGEILMGTMKGLYILDNEIKKVSRYTNENELTLLDKTDYHHLVSDQNGYLWASTHDGLFKLKNHKIIARYTVADGLSDNLIISVAIVDDVAWVVTDNGLETFNVKDNKFNKIYLNNDQFAADLSQGAVARHNGYLYFGGMQGVLYFKPGNFLESAKPPSTLITNFHLFNKPVMPDTGILSHTIDFTEQLELNYDDNMLTFEFSSRNYSQPNHLYAYQLEGLTKENDWIITDAKNRRATFTPPPGEYTFRVKSGWDKNTWSDEIAEVKVTILPPWWQTTWAYTLYITLTLITLFIIYQIRTRNMRLRSIELENQVKERTTALESKTLEVQSQKETIEQLMDKKNEMFANISHELRTPITLIHGPIHQTLEKFSYAKEVEPLIMAERNAERLSFLVDQLLQLSRMYDFPDENKQIYSLSKIAVAIASSFQSLSASQHLLFKAEIEVDIYLSALPNAIDTILINLISNAFKYTEKDGQIILTVIKQNGKAIISVKDTGIGMPQDRLQNIFDRFTRIESKLNKKVQGVGVGLALVKQLVELHQGNITVNTQEDEGTEFIVKLMASEPPKEINTNDETLDQESIKQIHYIESQFQTSQQQAKNPQLAQKDMVLASAQAKLLIIDDTDDMRVYLESLLSAEYQCILVDNGEEGVALAKVENPDIIISDVMMPGISGFDVLDRLREDLLTSHIPVLLLTAKGDKESRILGLSKLADDYITKPFDADELKARIHSILVIRQLQQRTLQKLVDENEQDEGEWQKADLSLKEKAFLDKLNEIMESNYHNEEFTVVELADNIHLSSRALLNKLKGLLGKTPNEYIRETRLNKAKELLLTGKVNIGELSGQVGFNNPSYFHRCFKAYVGCTPKQFIQANKQL